MSGKGALVDAGSFRIDRRRALDKLMKFQLPDANMYLLPLVQAAVAGQAGNIAVESGSGCLEISFDGKPWSGHELKDPYRCLFETGRGRDLARRRHLAVGLLAALRLKPEQIEVSSRSGGAERLLRVRSATEERLEERKASSGPARTMVSIRLPSNHSAALAYLKDRCRHCPVPIGIGEDLWPPKEDASAALSFRAGQVSGAVRLAPEALERSLIDFVSFGVTVATERPELAGIQVAGFVRDDDLRTTISWLEIIKDRRYAKALALAGRQARRLLERTLAETGRLAPGVGPLLASASLRREWMPWDSSVLDRFAKVLSLGPTGDSQADAVRAVSLRVAALRQAGLSRRAEMRRARRGALKALWEAPLLFDTAGKPLSLRALEDQRRVLGHVPYSDRSTPVPLAQGCAAWTPRPADLRFLKGFFPGDAAPVKQGWTEDRIDVMSVLDGKMLARLPLSLPDAHCELALASVLRKGGTRVRLIDRGVSLRTLDTGPLRLEAAVDVEDHERTHPAERGLDWERFKARLLAEAPRLYRMLADRYEPYAESPQQASIREHLLDLLAASWDKEKRALRENAWLRDVEVFRDDEFRMRSLASIPLLAGSDQDSAPAKDTVLLIPSHPRPLLHLSRGRPDRVSEILAGLPGVKVIKRSTWEAASLAAFRRAQRRAQAPAGPAPEAPAAADSPDRWLESLRSWSRAIPKAAVHGFPIRDLGRLALAASPVASKTDLVRQMRGRWELNADCPPARLIFGKGVPPADTPFLVSAAASAINRASTQVTDEADIRFQAALLDKCLAESGPSDYR